MCSSYAFRYMSLEGLLEAVSRFSTAWFPEQGGSRPYWFRARDPKHRTIIHALCSEDMDIIEATLTVYAGQAARLVEQLMQSRWSGLNMCLLGVMLDQMPRNALAIGFMGYTPDRVRSFDSFTLDYISVVTEQFAMDSISDTRVVCFVSLIYRHSNKFDEARRILLSLGPKGEIFDPTQLPSLAQKFWVETDKREREYKPIDPSIE